MEDRRETPDRAPEASQLLETLEKAEWQFLGEVRHLIDPDDNALLRLLVEECDRLLEQTLEAGRSERLKVIRKKLYTTAELNQCLPVLPASDFVKRRSKGYKPEAAPRPRRRSKRSNTGSPLPGFEAYHNKVMQWLDEKGLSQNSLAQHLQVDPSYLSRAVRGERRNRDLFLKLEELTGISAPYQPGDEDEADEESERKNSENESVH